MLLLLVDGGDVLQFCKKGGWFSNLKLCVCEKLFKSDEIELVMLLSDCKCFGMLFNMVDNYKVFMCGMLMIMFEVMLQVIEGILYFVIVQVQEY